MRKKGFTLAEVLITLAIIGVVAALTIPSVVKNYQKIQTVTQLKKVYSALANTTNLAVVDEGPINTWEIGTGGSGQSAIDFANKYLTPYLKVSKDCKTNTTSDCAFYYSYLNSNTVNTMSASSTRFYLNDGTLLAVAVIDEGPRRYANVMVDINGQKKPNILGKDVFHYRYETYSNIPKLVGKFMPVDIYGMTRDQARDNTIWGCNKNATGTYCSSLIMYDGWKISDDYPW